MKLNPNLLLLVERDKENSFFFLNHKVREDELIIHQSGEKVVADENIFFCKSPLEKMDDPTGSTASFIRKISSFRTFFCLIVSREGRSSRLLNRTTSQHPPTILRGIVSFRAIY